MPRVGLPLTAAKPVGTGDCPGGHFIDSARSARRACPDSTAVSDDGPSESVLAPLPPSALVRESERNPFDGPAHAVPRVGLPLTATTTTSCNSASLRECLHSSASASTAPCVGIPPVTVDGSGDCLALASASMRHQVLTRVGLPMPRAAVAKAPKLPHCRQAPRMAVPKADMTAHAFLCELVGVSSVVPWRLRNGNGQILAPDEVVQAGSQFQVDVATEPSVDMVLAKVSVCTAKAALHAQVSNEIRRSVASGLGPWMTDDVVADCLMDLQHPGSAVSVWTDPVLLTAGFQSSDVTALPKVSLPEGRTLLSACVIGGHWVAFCWQKVAGFVFAWTSLAGCQLVEEVGLVHWMFANRAGEGLRFFKFKDAPLRDLPPGLCGPVALLDLQAHLLRQPHRLETEVLEQATSLHHSRMLALLRPGTGRMPCLVAGVLGAMLEQGLTSLLKEKGVPEAVAGVRAKDLLSRAGLQAVQRAMVSSQPWRQLKAVCSNLVPSFQIVLPSELQAQIVRKVQAGEEVRTRAKVDKSSGTARSSPVPPLAVPSPDLLEVPSGVFEHEGRPLVATHS